MNDIRPSEALAEYLMNIINKEFDSASPKYEKIYKIARLLARVVSPNDSELSHLIDEIERKWNSYSVPEELIIDFAGLVLHKFEQSLCQPVSAFEEHGEKKESSE